MAFPTMRQQQPRSPGRTDRLEGVAASRMMRCVDLNTRWCIHAGTVFWVCLQNRGPTAGPGVRDRGLPSPAFKDASGERPVMSVHSRDSQINPPDPLRGPPWRGCRSGHHLPSPDPASAWPGRRSRSWARPSLGRRAGRGRTPSSLLGRLQDPYALLTTVVRVEAKARRRPKRPARSAPIEAAPAS